MLMAGKPFHPPQMHEFNASVQLMAKRLQDIPEARASYLTNGWPVDDSILDETDAIIFSWMEAGVLESCKTDVIA